MIVLLEIIRVEVEMLAEPIHGNEANGWGELYKRALVRVNVASVTLNLSLSVHCKECHFFFHPVSSVHNI